ncbi:uroporphyrinogen-III synthase [Pseudomonadota bacterium]
MEKETLALHGVTVVVTRPAKQATGLCQLIEQQGGTAICFPSLEIKEPDHPEKAALRLQQLEQFDTVIFVSRNAVAWSAHHIGGKLPTQIQLVAVGKSTGEALRKQWQHPIISPKKGSNSEAILALPEMQNVSGQHILIVRGQGGRELLAEQLSQRGAQVEYAEVYKRNRPNVSLSSLQASVGIDLISATSNEILQNLYDMAREEKGTQTRDWLLAQPLVVISQRTADLSTKLGFTYPATIATEASDTGLLNAMIQWHSHNK